MARYRDIATAFTKNGFGYFVRELGLDRVFSLPRRLLVNRDQNLEDKTVGERIRQFLEDLGPTFIKVGPTCEHATRFDSKRYPNGIIETSRPYISCSL